MLVDEIRQYFKALTDNKEVVKLAVTIQQQLEKGNTAITCIQLIEDKLISNNGSRGYIVLKDKIAGFRRFYNQEQFIAENFKNSKQLKCNNEKLNQAIKHVCETLKIQKPQQNDKQWQASLDFLQHSRFILTGGPGTGKTTTVIRMLLLYEKLNPDSQIALAAPTGKAANRMMQSMNEILPEHKQQVAQTLHRLLGYTPQTNRLKFNEKNLLAYDLIIIDEASMLDVSICYRLLQAIKPTTQLLLIGDKNQLASVEAGNVFSNLSNLLTNNKKELTINYRFSSDSRIANLCQSLIGQDTTTFQNYVNNINPKDKQEKSQQLRQWYKQVGIESSIILSPVNYGNNSVKELNDLSMQILYKNNNLYSEGMPIIVNQNDYSIGVFNGDIGFLRYIDSQWQVPFMIEGKQKPINLDAISNWQVAHAITIHKSQGSEYNHVLIVIPDDEELEILTNSLLYTAISRAKKSVTIWASDKILGKIIKTKENRKTFLN